MSVSCVLLACRGLEIWPGGPGPGPVPVPGPGLPRPFPGRSFFPSGSGLAYAKFLPQFRFPRPNIQLGVPRYLEPYGRHRWPPHGLVHFVNLLSIRHGIGSWASPVDANSFVSSHTGSSPSGIEGLTSKVEAKWRLFHNKPFAKQAPPL